MVALHNKKLSDKDLFRGVLWTDKEITALRKIHLVELEAEGTTGPERIFSLSRKMEQYQQAQPSMRERQAVMKRIYPMKVKPSNTLTDDEIIWLIERLSGVNDPTGVDILAKLETLRK